MTEAEAKTKWCPFARERAAQGMPDGGGNRAPYGSGEDGPVEDDYTREMRAPASTSSDRPTTCASARPCARQTSLCVPGGIMVISAIAAT